MEEAQGFRALLDLEEPKHSIEQIAAKVGIALASLWYYRLGLYIVMVVIVTLLIRFK